MKKHHVVAMVGTLALLANLLVPGLAFGQAQDGEITIDCPGVGTAVLQRVPADVTFDSVSPDPLAPAKSSVDASVTNNLVLPGGNTVLGGLDGTPVPNDHILGFTDTRGQSVPGCPVAAGGISITVAMTTLNVGVPALNNGSDPTKFIPGANLHLVMTDNVDDNNIDPRQGVSTVSAIHYIDYAAQNDGNQHNLAILGVTQTGPNIDWEDPATYFPGSANHFGALSGLTLMSSCAATGDQHNFDAFTGIALAITDGISPTQAKGVYTGTIQYTFSAAAC